MSGAGAYFSVVRQSDHISGLVTTIPFVVIENNDIVVLPQFTLALINSGNRAAAVNNVELSVKQGVDEIPDRQCEDGYVFSTDFEPLVIKEKEIASRTLRATREILQIDDLHKMDAKGIIRFPISEKSKGQQSFWVDVCLSIRISTPSIGVAHKQVRVATFRWRKVDLIGIYTLDFERIIVGDNRPFVIWSKTGSVFQD